MSWDLGLWPFLSWDLGPDFFKKSLIFGNLGFLKIWDLGPDPFWTLGPMLGPGIMAFFELGPGPRPLFEPGIWDLGHLEGGLNNSISKKISTGGIRRNLLEIYDI